MIGVGLGVVCVHTRLHVNNVLSFCIGGGSGRNQYILARLLVHACIRELAEFS